MASSSGETYCGTRTTIKWFHGCVTQQVVTTFNFFRRVLNEFYVSFFEITNASFWYWCDMNSGPVVRGPFDPWLWWRCRQHAQGCHLQRCFESPPDVRRLHSLHGWAVQNDAAGSLCRGRAVASESFFGWLHWSRSESLPLNASATRGFERGGSIQAGNWIESHANHKRFKIWLKKGTTHRTKRKVKHCVFSPNQNLMHTESLFKVK